MVKIRHLATNKIWASDLPLVIGYFSCVHVMHVQLLSKYQNFNIFTFNDFYSKKNNAIYSFNERITNLEKYKPENIYVMDLNRFNMTALEFIIKVLKPINPSIIVVGEDFKFGSDQKGVDFLRNYFRVETLKYNKSISTTNIIKDIKANKLERANGFLDEPYYYISKWIVGRKIGRTIGYNTINLEIRDNFVISDGTYVTVTEIGSKKYLSVSFVGTSATTGSSKRTLECHIINMKVRNRMLYPSLTRNYIKVSFLKQLRKNRRFINSDKLHAQIKKDIAAAEKYFRENENI